MTPTTDLIASASRTQSYPVVLAESPAAVYKTLIGLLEGRRALLITDRSVSVAYGDDLVAELLGAGIPTALYAMFDGESSKQWTTAGQLLDWLAQNDMHRRDVIVAIGGGVVCDVAGWVAGVYMRGVPYINVPTSLMAQVDAGLGGKVGIDHGTAKNLIGAFHQPLAVVTCPEFLATLSRRHLRNGLAEVVKKAVIASPELFGYLERNWSAVIERRQPVLQEVIAAATHIKLALVARDPFENDLRRSLNFGHTVGHVIETVTGYGPVLHGEAVSVGMATAVQISLARGAISPSTAHRIVGLLRDIGLPISVGELVVPVETDAFVAALEKVRQIRDGSLRYVLPLDLGAVQICDDVTGTEIATALQRASYVERTA